MKMHILPSPDEKESLRKMLGDYNMSQPKLYTDKIIGSLSACMVLSGIAVKERFVPQHGTGGRYPGQVRHR